MAAGGKYKRSRAECDAILTAKGMPWETMEIELNGRRQVVWKNTPKYYRLWAEPLLKQGGDKLMVLSPLPAPASSGHERFTYAEVLDRTVRMAAWMRKQGIKQGDRVAVAGSNSAMWLVCAFAVHWLGGVAVLVNSHMTHDTMAYCLAHTKPKLVMCDAAVAQELGGVADKLRGKGIGPLWCWSSVAHLPTSIQAGVQQAVPNPSQAEYDAVANGVGLEGMHHESPCTIYFTSGTTGYPKAVLSTQRQNLHNAHSGVYTPLRSALRVGADIKELLKPKPAGTPQSIILLPIPLFHCTGGESWVTRCLSGAGALVFMHRWNVKDAVDLCVRERVNVIGGVPSIATAIFQSPDLPRDHEFLTMSYGGAPPAARLAHDLSRRWPNVLLVHGYGMTETNAIHTATGGQDYLDHPDSVGWTVPVCEVKIVDETTREELPTGEVGVICMRGQNVMSCYLDDPEATAKAMDKDGWLDSGDVGCIDADGFVYIRDRSKDLIIRGGENIASLEVENALALDDRVAEAAAVPVPCPLMGERVGAIVSMAPGATATPDDIIKTVAPRLRHAARPAIVLVHPGPLPRNANGKIVKTDCKQIVGEEWKKGNGRLDQPRAKL